MNTTTIKTVLRIAVILLLGRAVSAVDLVLPHFAVGGGYRTELLLSNTMPQGWSGTVEFLKGVGAPFGDLTANGAAAVDTYLVAVPRLGTVAVRLESDGPLRTGYLKVRGADGLVVSALYADATSAVGVMGSASRRILYVPVEREAGHVYTGVAWANTSLADEVHYIRLDCYDEDGTLVDSRMMRGVGHLARYIDELVALPREFRRGMLRIESPYEFSAVALRQEFRADGASTVTSVPVR